MIRNRIPAILMCSLAAIGACSQRPPVRRPQFSTSRQPELPLNVSCAELQSGIVESLRKRVAGRMASLPDIERVIREDARIIAQAARMLQVQPAIQQIAKDEGITPDAARERW